MLVREDVHDDTAEVLLGQGVPASTLHQVQELVHLGMATSTQLLEFQAGGTVGIEAGLGEEVS